jgi:hypothetical protein
MKTSAILVWVWWATLIMASGQINPPPLEWQKVYGGTYFDDFSAIHETADGGFILGGRSDSGIDGNYDLWIIRLDTDGNLLWEQSFGGDTIDEYPQTSEKRG